MRGFFEIGIFNPKHGVNIGTLWRSAYQLGAAGIFTIHQRYKMQASDTCKAHRHIPMRHYTDFQHFNTSRPYSAPLVVIEFGGESLEAFDHPMNAVYLLGSEDNGLPDSIIQSAQYHIQIPSVRTLSYNVAMAGTIIMYDRLVKQVVHGS